MGFPLGSESVNMDLVVTLVLGVLIPPTSLFLASTAASVAGHLSDRSFRCSHGIVLEHYILITSLE